MANNRELSQFANVVGYNGGNIGLGTDNPQDTLDVANAVPQIRLTDLSDGSYGQVRANGGNLILRADEGNTVADSVIVGEIDGDEKVRIDSSGRILQGLTSAKTGFFNDNNAAPVHQIQGSTYYTTAFSIFRNGSGQSGPNFILAKGREAIVQDDDILGSISFQGHDGTTELIEGASIQARVNGTPGSNDMPGCLTFNTSSDDSALPTERLRITSGGALEVKGTRAGSLQPSDDDALQLYTKSTNNNVDRGTGITFYNHDNSGYEMGGTIQVAKENGTADNVAAYMRFSTRPAGGSATERIRITSTGLMGLGTSSPGSYVGGGENLVIAGSGDAGMTIATGTSNTGTINFADGTSGDARYRGRFEYSHSSDALDILTAATTRMRIASNGEQQHFGTNATNINIANSASAGNQYEFLYCQHSSTGLANGTNSFRVATDGDVFNTNNSYGSLSDQRLKENIVDATSQWEDIKGLQVRKYNFRENTGHETHTQLGLIAQEVESVSPGLVSTSTVREGETVLDADGNQLESIKSINYSVLYMKAVKALQEAQTRIETLETQNTDLLARVTALEGS